MLASIHTLQRLTFSYLSFFVGGLLMYLYYIKFNKVLKKTEYNTWAIIAKSWDDAVKQVSDFGEGPILVAGPYNLNDKW